MQLKPACRSHEHLDFFCALDECARHENVIYVGLPVAADKGGGEVPVATDRAHPPSLQEWSERHGTRCRIAPPVRPRHSIP
eukprot:9486177-Pyramimonas_sp.AAC.1